VDLTDDGTKDCGSGKSGEMPAMTDAKPDIFLCHNSADKDWVLNLAERLEAESIDAMEGGRRIRVFLDAWDIEKGENIVARLGTELATGAFVAAVMSPEFFGSDWTTLEWTDIVARDPANASGKLLPLRVRDASLDGKTRVAFPAPFNALRHFDFRSEARFEVEFQDLVRRIRKLPLPRGRALAARYSSSAIPSDNAHAIETAEAVPEILLSNLFPLTASPPRLFTATATVASVAEIPNEPGFDALTLMIWAGKVVTFVDLEDPECVLNRIIDPRTVERIEFQSALTTAILPTGGSQLRTSLLQPHFEIKAL
jgi:TIR domain